MATETTVTLVDDMDGSLAEESIEFRLDKREYEIDLSAANAAKLREVLAPFIAGARKVSGRHLRSVPTGGPSRAVSADREQNQAIREWAAKRGMKVAERGRIPADVLDAYHEDRRNGSEAPTAAPQPAPEPVRFAAAPEAPKAAPAPRKPRSARGNGAVEPPKAAPAAFVTRMNKLTETMIGAVCEFVGELVVDHGESWVELTGERDDIAAKITAVQSDMPGESMTQRAAKAALTRVVKELRNVKSRKVEERAA